MQIGGVELELLWLLDSLDLTLCVLCREVCVQKMLSLMMVYCHTLQDRGKYIAFNVPGNLWEALMMSGN